MNKITRYTIDPKKRDMVTIVGCSGSALYMHEEDKALQNQQEAATKIQK